MVIQTKTGLYLHAKVKEILQEGRSYNLITNLGATLRWNQVKLRPLYEVTSDESSDEEETDSIHENSETSDPDVHVTSETRDDVNQTRKGSRVPAPRKPVNLQTPCGQNLLSQLSQALWKTQSSK